MNEDFYAELPQYTVNIFVEGGLNVPFNMNEQEVARVFRQYHRPFFLRPPTLQLMNNDGQTKIAIRFKSIVTIEANDVMFLKKRNDERQREAEALQAGKGAAKDEPKTL